MKIALGSDHGGFALKEHLRDFIRKEFGYDVVDFGTHSTEAVDYPDFAFLVAAAVAEGQCQLGIMIDGAGLGSSMVANKLPGIRAAVCNDLFAARNSRAHNQANVLTLGARIIGDMLAEEIVRVFLSTPFETRHQKRIDKILRLEQEIYGFGRA
ncbi:MAG: ribose 5-phosphate isomerase B [Candidatus Sericytochromatia bacterium]|nr:ribose 5-phosphate isomerase B [Candidatus Sericytochromatia bacterium]